MFTRYQAPRLVAAALLLGSLACASPVLAADDAMTPPSSDNAVTAQPHQKHHGAKEGMQQKVEDRISTLHTKLKITPDQEAAWNDVAQAMRDSEASIGGLIHDRHQSAETMTAVQDLEAYQKIAQAHADGLQKVIAAFTTLYNSMSDTQKQNADKVFGTFEGHMHGMHGMHKDATPAAPNSQTK